jgi:protein TonB
MKVEALQKYRPLVRPLLFGLVIAIHIIVLVCVRFSVKEAALEEEIDAEIFKLVDVEEFVPPPPPPPVIEKKEVVVNSVKASETIQETEKEVVEVEEEVPVEIEYVPQHKISVVPEIPTKAILSKIEYPKMAMKQGIEGVVYLELFIDESGNIRRINVLKDPGYGFADAAIAALDGIRCKPALVNDKPVAVRFRYPVRFVLN